MIWTLTVIDSNGSEHMHTGESPSLRKAERHILRAIKRIEEDLEFYATDFKPDLTAEGEDEPQASEDA